MAPAMGPRWRNRRAPPPSASCRGCRSDRAWRSRAPCATPCAQHATSLWAALFQLKIASSGRGALAGTRCAHLNCKNKETEGSVGIKVSQEG
jgi:hypothetical protein